MRTYGALGAALVVVASAGSAQALKQSTHQQITHEECVRAGLPDFFCLALGAQAYNVDSNEWTDLSAHAQVTVGKTSCESANASLWRVFFIGQQVRYALAAFAKDPNSPRRDELPIHIGRALHTLQDNCAHSGMPNPQHAWYSLSDQCQGTSDSPDIQSAAIACARTETSAFFAAFNTVAQELGADTSQLKKVVIDDDTFWPSVSQACEFLASANQWDGKDRRWNNAVVRPALQQHFMLGLGGAARDQFQRLCSDSSDELTISFTPWYRDVSGGAQSCTEVFAFCLGKADSVAAAPPWETAPHAAAQGCQLGGHASLPRSAGVLFVLGLLGALLALRPGRARA